MTESDLEAVVARTGHARYRWLTSEANPDAKGREAYRSLVARLAREEAPAPASPTRPASLADWRWARRLGSLNCLYASKPACSCQGAARCHALARTVTLRDCRDCLAPTDPIDP